MATKDEVAVKFSAETAEIIRAYQQQEKQLEKLTGKLKDVAATGKLSGKNLKDSFEGAVVAGEMAVRMFDLAKEGIKELIHMEEEHRRQQFEAGVTLDEQRRRFRVAAGLTDTAAAKPTTSAIESTAAAAGATLEESFAAATKMAREGFTPQQIAGGGLESLIGAGVATGRAPADLVKTFREMTRGQDRSAEAMESAAAQLTAMTRGTGLEPETLGELFKKLRAGGGARGKLGLKMLGLRPEEVDLQGETPLEALQKLRTASRRVGETKGTGGLSRLVGPEQGTNLFEALGKLKDMDVKTAVENFRALRETGEGGVSAAQRGIEAGKVTAFAGTGEAEFQTALDKVDQLRREGGMGETAIKLQRAFANIAQLLNMLTLGGFGRITGETRIREQLKGRDIAPILDRIEANTRNAKLVIEPDGTARPPRKPVQAAGGR